MQEVVGPAGPLTEKFFLSALQQTGTQAKLGNRACTYCENPDIMWI